MFAALWLGGAAAAADLTIFAAASLKEALDANVKAFNLKTSHKVRVSYAGSNALARQIENGAPADVFIAADVEWMDYLAQKKMLVTATRRDLATNRLVLIAPAQRGGSLKIAPKFPLALALDGGKLAVANPETVPVGKYAKAALIRLDVWRDVEKILTRSENVRAALVLVARGEAPLGIVYATDAEAEPKVRLVDTFASDLHPPIVYPAAIVAGQRDPAAQVLLDFLSGAEARVVWRKYGFGVPP